MTFVWWWLYAPIVGALGALAVPAIVLLFTLRSPTPHVTSLITFCAGLLIVAMIGSLIGSIGFVAISAEQAATAHIPAAVIFTGVPVVLSVVNILTAFEVLSAIYLPHSKMLFALIAGIGGALGVYFLSYAVADSWETGPLESEGRESWLENQWIKSQAQGHRLADIVGLTGAGPILLGIILRLADLGLAPTPTAIDWVVGLGLALAVVGTLLGNNRTRHPLDNIQKGLRAWESFGATIGIALYVLLLLEYMP